MAQTLTCDCGARFEVEGLPPGGKAPCPECKFEVRVPGRPQPPPPRASLAALLSPWLALTGAFTLVGTVAAALAGLYGLLEVRRAPDRLTGAPFAVAGLVLAAVFSLLTLFGYLQANALPLDGWLRAGALTGQAEALEGQQVAALNGEITLSLPLEGWVRIKSGKTAHPVVGELQQGCDVLLFHPRLNAYFDVARIAGNNAPPAGGEDEWLREQHGKPRPPLLGSDEDVPMNPMSQRLELPHLRRGAELPPFGELQPTERLLTLRRGAVRWEFIIRTYRKQLAPGAVGALPLWVVRGYSPAHRFPASEAELRGALDGVRFPQ